MLEHDTAAVEAVADTAQTAHAVLIHVTGVDRPGLTHSFTSVLAEHGARVLDIGQAVIHQALALGILAELPGEVCSPAMLDELQAKAREHQVTVRCAPISRDEYSQWVAAEAKRRFLVTLLAPTITSMHLAEVSGVVARQGLNIDRIDRLSHRVPLDAAARRTCIELAVSGNVADEESLRASLVRLTQSNDFDIAVQRDDAYRRHRRLVAFDMDSTLIRCEVIDELAKLAGVGEQVSAITAAAMRGEFDFQASFRKRVALLEGLSEEALAEVVARVPLMDGMERLMKSLKALGYKTAILSGGFTFMGRELQRRFGIDYMFANELEIAGGKVTGRVVTEIVDGARKAALLRELAKRENLPLEQVIAVGDGANDLPMLSIAGLGIAFRAKPIVRGSARHSISALGLDSILYLLGVRDREIVSAD